MQREIYGYNARGLEGVHFISAIKRRNQINTGNHYFVYRGTRFVNADEFCDNKDLWSRYNIQFMTIIFNWIYKSLD